MCVCVCVCVWFGGYIIIRIKAGDIIMCTNVSKRTLSYVTGSSSFRSIVCKTSNYSNVIPEQQLVNSENANVCV